jgi:hypothetical protein
MTSNLKILICALVLLAVAISFVIMKVDSKEKEREQFLPVITNKFVTDGGGDVMPKCFCRFYYSADGFSNREFSDSCQKYNVGDTIVGRKRNH